MKVRYTAQARDDSRDAAKAFTHRDPTTEPRFKERLREVVRSIARYPELGASFGRYRRVPLSPFPYVLFYEILEDTILVVAIAHTSREPGSWQDR